MTYYSYGAVASTNGSDGTSVQASADASTNYAAPTTVTAQSYSESISYNSWLGLTQTTRPNGEQLTMTYDRYDGRPTSGTSPYGATTTYTYSASGVVPAWQTTTGPDGVTTTTLDGLGRAIRVARGDTSAVKSYTDSVYAPCACSPLGKVQKVSMPYAPGTPANQIGWTVYTYDGMGRTLTVKQPDGASTTTTSYSGNQTTVTDPAGKWKKFTSDVEGNLVTVVEPDPASQPSGTLTTSYTYDWMKHLTGVSMPRGTTTQTRTFVYDDAGRMTSATNPENGLVSYSYNADNTLHYKHDYKGQEAVYTYDAQKRPVQLQYYPNGQTGYEDLCQRVSYFYDTNPVSSTFSSYTAGRLTATQYASCSMLLATMSFTEEYSYHPGGAVTKKRLEMNRSWSDASGFAHTGVYDLDASYSYDQAGRRLAVTYPGDWASQMNPITYTYGYDSMGRPSSLTDSDFTNGPNGTNAVWAQNVGYDYAGRMTSMQYLNTDGSTYHTEARTYNVNGQLASLGGFQYTYSATQNNGQVTQVTANGATVTYQYDALKRLISAASSGSWTETYGYDGFGNLTAKVLNGVTTSIPVHPETNQLVNGAYDNNGNTMGGTNSLFTYDAANRVVAANAVSGGTETYSYAPDNKRIYKADASGVETWTLYGIDGKKLGAYRLWDRLGGGSSFEWQVQARYVWFGSKLVHDSGASVTATDRLGTGFSSRPYGDPVSGGSTDGMHFATYTRDGFTGLDYADQRYYASSYGRFNTADPDLQSGSTGDPATWNQYTYSLGDPVNYFDPAGTTPIPTFTTTVFALSASTTVYLTPSLLAIYGYSPQSSAYATSAIAAMLAQSQSARGAGTSSVGDNVKAAKGLLQKDTCVRLIGAKLKDDFQTAENLSALLDRSNPHLDNNLPVPTATADPADPNRLKVSYRLGADDGGEILLNGKIFPDAGKNIGGTSVSVLSAFNQSYGTALSADQLEVLTILHELSHVAHREDDTNDPAATREFNQAILRDCIK